MNFSIIKYMLGWVLNVEGAFMLLPCITSLFYREREGWYYLLCALLCVGIGGIIVRRKPDNSQFFAKEGFVAVALSWIIMSLMGALPMCLTGEIPNYIDALFEAASGFTTTGASIVPNVELLSHSTNLWRCFTHWIGGMGVLVFIMAILPASGGQDMYFMKAESPGPSVGKLVPRIQKTAKYLYIIYCVFTVTEFLVLLIAGMPIFDALCTSFGTAGTGGYGIKADSMAGYSVTIQNIVTVFMLIFGVNFSFYFLLLNRKPKDAFGIEEVKVYLGIFVLSSVCIAINMCNANPDFLGNLQQSTFQVASVMTTTGYATADFNLWAGFSKTIMVLIMFVGACAGSTGGGMKVSRILIYLKSLKSEISQTIHPRSVKVLRMDGKALSGDVVKSAKVFLIAYIAVFVVSLLIISLDNFDLVTNFTSVTSAINNIGPGLEVVGPTGNFAGFSALSKLVLTFDMLAGRLEMIPILLLLTPQTWKKH